MSIAENIKKYAHEKNKSISQIEAEAGLGNGAIGKWNASSPTITKLKEVANVLECSIEDLIKE